LLIAAHGVEEFGSDEVMRFAVLVDTVALKLRGIPVVWFTSNSLPLWLVGLGCDSDMCMLTVDINRKRLHHWRSWLAKVSAPESVVLPMSGTSPRSAMPFKFSALVKVVQDHRR
jgi:hypothetical protein